MANISIERGGSDSELSEMDYTSLSLSQYMPDKKYKGSPLTDNRIKKQNSLPDISRLTTKEKNKKSTQNFF